MDLALHFSYCVCPMTKQGFRQIPDSPSPSFGKSLSRFRLQEKASSSSSSMGRLKRGSVCCKKQSDEGTSKQEEIISLFRLIQASISKGESTRGVEEEKKNREGSPENVPLSKAILAILEKPRKQTEDSGEKGTLKRQVKVAQPPSSFAKKSPTRPSDSVPRGKFPVSKSDVATEEMTEKEEKAPLIIETMKLAELKEVAKNRGIKGYSKLKKSELLKLIRSY